MRQMRYIWSCILITAFQTSLIAQDVPGSWKVMHWDLENGLSQANTYKFLKDARGFLWIETESGLNRFDGSKIKNYFGNPHSNQTIAYSRTCGLVEDSLHNVWIGSDSGLCRYDLRADTFTHLTPEAPDSINGKQVNPFWSTRDKIYTFEFGRRICSYDVHSFKRTSYWFPPHQYIIGAALSDRYPAFDEKTNSVWLTFTGPGWTGGGLMNFSLSTGKIAVFTWPCYRNIIDHSHFTESLLFDPATRTIWLNSADGLLSFDVDSKTFQIAEPFRALIKEKDYHQWAGIGKDSQGNIWLGLIKQGIVRYNPKTKEIFYPFAQDSVLKEKVSRGNVCVYCDKDDVIWLGTWNRKGFFQMFRSSNFITRYSYEKGNTGGLSAPGLKKSLDGPKDQIWIGGFGGINIFEPSSGKFSHIYYSEKGNINKEAVLIPVLMDTLAQTAWLVGGGKHKALTLNLQNGQFKELSMTDRNGKLFEPVGSTIPAAYGDGFIMVAKSATEDFIFQFDKHSDTGRWILTFKPEQIDIFRPIVGNKDWLFLRSVNGKNNLSYHFELGKWVQRSTRFDSIHYVALIFNSIDKSYWMATTNQFLHFDTLFHVIRIYPYELVDRDPVFAMINDDQGNLWFNTDRSILKLNALTGKIHRLSAIEGFERQNFDEIAFPYRSKTGELYFPGGMIYGNGFDKINPKNIRENYPASIVYFERLVVDRKGMGLYEDSASAYSIDLDHTQNQISLETGSIDFFSRSTNRIRYKLDRKGDDWNYAPANYTIRYEGLPPGKYKLIVQASNAADEFIGREKILQIRVHPAFWNTSAFFVFVLIVFLLCIWALVRHRVNLRYKRRLETAESQHQVARLQFQTAQLQHQATELEMKALRAQMNPHFIFNSLNSINRFILQNNRAQASEYLTKFSKLVRLILQNSQASLITLESELDSLKLYLDLEALRFDYKFDFKISVPKDLDISDIKVPPLIIQPYAENAIWHGLMHKETTGRLDIELSQDEQNLYIRIADDGIGREMAMAYSSKSATRHKSLGLNITAERIAHLKDNDNIAGQVTINDLYSSEGQPAGTEVIIKIPILYD